LRTASVTTSDFQPSQNDLKYFIGRYVTWACTVHRLSTEADLEVARQQFTRGKAVSQFDAYVERERPIARLRADPGYTRRVEIGSVSIFKDGAMVKFTATEQASGEREAKRTRMIATLQFSLSPPADDERLYLATWSGDSGHAVAVQRGEHALFVEASEAAPAAAFADDLAAEHPSLQGVTGALEACESFARRWQARTARAMILRAHLRHHLLTDVASVPAAPGRMRMADDADAGWLLDASHAFVAEAGMPDTPSQVRRNVPVVLAQRRYRIWEDDGIAAFAGWSDAGEGDARIGPVYTPLERRRRGYATALVAALASEIKANGGRRIFLTTDVANPTSNAIYARIGFRPLSDFYHFDFVAR